MICEETKEKLVWFILCNQIINILIDRDNTCILCSFFTFNVFLDWTQQKCFSRCL